MLMASEHAGAAIRKPNNFDENLSYVNEIVASHLSFLGGKGNSGMRRMRVLFVRSHARTKASLFRREFLQAIKQESTPPLSYHGIVLLSPRAQQKSCIVRHQKTVIHPLSKRRKALTVSHGTTNPAIKDRNGGTSTGRRRGTHHQTNRVQHSASHTTSP